MQKQITRISPFQTAKVLAALYFVVTIPFLLIFAVISLFAPTGQRFGMMFLVVAPFIYAIFGFVFTFVGAYVYNLVARFTGGIEFTTTEVRDF